MKIDDKLFKNILKIMKTTGFFIYADGDSSAGISPTSWKLDGDFYFDDQEELDLFRTEIKNLFEFYCGDSGITVDSFEELSDRYEDNI